MQQVQVIINQIIILTLLGLTGFISSKTNFLPESSGIVISRLVVKLCAPVLIFTTISSYTFTSDIIKDGIWIYIGGIVFNLIAFLIATQTSQLLKLQGATSSIYKMQSMFGNVIFLAFPILHSVFGDKGLVYSIFFNLANDTLLWTLGIYLLYKYKVSHWKENLKHLINGNTIAFGGGILCMVFDLQHYVKTVPQVEKIYTLFFDTFHPLGKTTIYLSMLFIGMIMAKVEIRNFYEIRKRAPILILSFFKLLFVPIFALIVLRFFSDFISTFVVSIIVLQLAMPSGTLVTALAAQYDSDYEFATECCFFSTLLSIVTLPLIILLLNL